MSNNYSGRNYDNKRRNRSRSRDRNEYRSNQQNTHGRYESDSRKERGNSDQRNESRYDYPKGLTRWISSRFFTIFVNQNILLLQQVVEVMVILIQEVIATVLTTQQIIFNLLNINRISKIHVISHLAI